jgi:KUP system potassium uptake protein
VTDTVTSTGAATSRRAHGAHVINVGDGQRHGALRAGIVLAALGVVFGDIGTSPLYSLQTVFSLDHGIVRATPGDVYGVISLVFWAVTLVVTIK